MTIYSLDVLLSWFGTSPLFHVCFNCCFLMSTQISQEAGKVVWYSHLLNFPQFLVIHRVKGFSIVNEAEVVVLLEFPCFFYDPVGVSNLISGSSAFSKSSLYIWRFLVHILLKPSLKDFEHYLTSMWNERNCKEVWLPIVLPFETERRSWWLETCLQEVWYKMASMPGSHTGPCWASWPHSKEEIP